ELTVRDLGSTNGTVLDGVKVKEACLREGSLLRLGSSALQVRLGKSKVQLPLSEKTAFGSLVGGSVAMRQALTVLELAAESHVTVLIEGEPGTGREGAAASIHDASARRTGPFVIVDCAAIPAELLESELFGHEKGAFTGAHQRRAGAFEEA